MSRVGGRKRTPVFDRADCEARLAAGVAALGVALPVGGADRLLDYLAVLSNWNATHNLTAVREPAAMVSRHLLDCLAIVDFIDGPRVADVGSGAGLPGLVLAIARPELHVTLFEANGKKVAFLRQARRTLALDNVDVMGGRVEAAEATATFDWVVTRAFATAADTLALAGELIGPVGRLGLMKGRDPADELADLPAGFVHEASHRVRVPGLDAERRFTIVARDPS
ncbi:16S rRNA (guanine(527)-N(7))-methyltransferase RsmG [Salinisphaera sp. Q1T1-3]|uniref:16S rRNA (guanine(527)-N(7))-methyltransferase RsmG n=1 Tax=Salinisphaera sp. Q1T1-3 TaxID=2321229 RepID=UPI000E72E537|nr:16S rRNA (guanine(527)-N(7))-methyltransferase RsmG [Salinisphaera sp. Q1T1-3]RJS93325.1 16S rRNA (guanine(527)-N(7))-methyltransferase RsmG [Salinisphaera sp. Q1T1-3]